MNEDQVSIQQDKVDGAIYEMLCIVAGKDIDWNIQIIASVRDRVLVELQEFHNLSPDTLYPFYEEEV